jgi:hypothetical protein
MPSDKFTISSNPSLTTVGKLAEALEIQPADPLAKKKGEDIHT